MLSRNNDSRHLCLVLDPFKKVHTSFDHEKKDVCYSFSNVHFVKIKIKSPSSLSFARGIGVLFVYLNSHKCTLFTAMISKLLPSPNPVYFYTAHTLKTIFIFLNGLKKKKNGISWHMKIKWNSSFNFHNKALLEHSYIHVVMYHLWLLLHSNGINK